MFPWPRSTASFPAHPPPGTNAPTATPTPRFPRPAPRGPRLLAGRSVRVAPAADDLGRDLALPVGAAASAVAVTTLLVTGQATHFAFSLVAFALLTVAIAAAARPRVVPAVLLVSWMFFDGFVVHQHAELGWQQTDRTSFWILAGAGLSGAVCAATARAAGTRRARRQGAAAPSDRPRDAD
ncbi:hypothetical protein [Streptomyces sp. WZ-12]|uniref:hypothetical protein n=1 Tax=Streptomyces sp. WZ-12 TaxID=3030210 RepID=UPI002380C925|nr:hypothetical protein [Streptomyces sp. WZ-12]